MDEYTSLPAPPPADQWSGAHLLGAFRAAARWLEQHADVVNALNVFPVPDGDTGTNMSLTLNGAIDGVEADPSCAVVADTVRYWATMRGRGNSGIILSQVLRGFALGLHGQTWMGGRELAVALESASAAAYQAVMKPVEGTMLTTIRMAAEAAVASPEHSVVAVLSDAVAAANAAVEQSPQLLKTLRDAGVVDSGGRGLALILEGMHRYATGQSVELGSAQPHPVSAMAFEDVHGVDDFGYCTNFVVQGQQMPFAEIRETLGAMGQSVAVVGDETLIKVHIHLLRPGDVLNYALQYGTLDRIEIANMDVQREALHRAAATEAPAAHVELDTAVGVVAVSSGDGFAAIFRSLGAGEVIGGGQTMNPSTENMLEAVARLPQQDIVLLPNNSNVLMAARQAAAISDKRIEVVPSKTLPQGIAAMLRFNYQADLAANASAMTSALGDVCTAEITCAVRDATVDGVAVRAGQTIGLLDGTLVAADDDEQTLVDRLLDQMELDDREVVTVYHGRDTARADADALAEHIAERFPDVGVEVQAGGQALFDYILSAE